MVEKEEDSVVICYLIFMSFYLFHQSLCNDVYKDLRINDYKIKSPAIKVEKKRFKNVIMNVIYRQLNGGLKVSENYFNDFFSKNEEMIKNNTCRTLQF